MGTIAIVDSLGNETTLVNQGQSSLPTQVNESAEQASAFDTKKWKKIINGNVDMIQRKVDQSTPHHVLHRELDDLKMIIANCFD